jgi:hypothetical protein
LCHEPFCSGWIDPADLHQIAHGVVEDSLRPVHPVETLLGSLQQQAVKFVGIEDTAVEDGGEHRRA